MGRLYCNKVKPKYPQHTYFIEVKLHFEKKMLPTLLKKQTDH